MADTALNTENVAQWVQAALDEIEIVRENCESDGEECGTEVEGTPEEYQAARDLLVQLATLIDAKGAVGAKDALTSMLASVMRPTQGKVA